MKLLRPDPPIRLAPAPRPKLQRQVRITLHHPPTLRLVRRALSMRSKSPDRG